MEIVTAGQRLQNNTNIYQLEKDGNPILLGDAKSIVVYLGLSPKSVSRVRQGKNIKKHRAKFYGIYEYRYNIDGVIGTREEIARALNLTVDSVRKRTEIKDYSIGGYVKGVYAYPITVEELHSRKQPKTEIIKKIVPCKVYKSPNQAYVDSLFKSCFKGWRE